MIYSHEVEMMCPVAQGANHGPAPIPEEAKWVQAKEVKDISGLTHGVGWCAPQQGTCKLTLNVKEGITETLKEVPKEKVINGLPLFTRLWIESSEGYTSYLAGKGTEQAYLFFRFGL